MLVLCEIHHKWRFTHTSGKPIHSMYNQCFDFAKGGNIPVPNDVNNLAVAKQHDKRLLNDLIILEFHYQALQMLLKHFLNLYFTNKKQGNQGVV